MADLIGVRVKCPECGATMRANGEVVSCTYCGTESRVQRRTQFLQRPVQLPPVGPSQPKLIAVQRRSNTGLRIAIALGVAGATAAPMIWSATRALPAGASLGGIPVTETWETGHPLLVDLDGDGIEDAIGVVWLSGGRDEMHLRAVSGATGKTLWESVSLGAYQQVYQSRLVLADGVVLFAETDRRPHLGAYDAKTGASKWSIAPPEVVQDVCGDRDGQVRIVTKDEVEASIELATGKSTPVTKKAPCAPLPSTEHNTDPLFDTNNRHWGFAPPGMRSDQIVGDRSSWILSGDKSPGSPVPMVAVIDDHEHVIWKAQLASTEPMSSRRLVKQIVAFDAKLVATVYGRTIDKQPSVLVGFDRATGARVFETAFPVGVSESIMGVELELGPTTVWSHLGDGLQAYDRKTGVLRWRVGRP